MPGQSKFGQEQRGSMYDSMRKEWAKGNDDFADSAEPMSEWEGAVDEGAETAPAQEQKPPAKSAQGNDESKEMRKRRERSLLIFGLACLVACVLTTGLFTTTSVDTSQAAQEALSTGVSSTLPIGTRLATNDSETSAEPTDYTVEGEMSESTTTLYMWDYAGEDGDYVQVLVNGDPVTEEFMIKHQPREITVPTSGTVQIKGIHDAGGGLTYAAYYDLNGVTYFNNAPEGVLNTYTIAAS